MTEKMKLTELGWKTKTVLQWIQCEELSFHHATKFVLEQYARNTKISRSDLSAILEMLKEKGLVELTD